MQRGSEGVDAVFAKLQGASRTLAWLNKLGGGAFQSDQTRQQPEEAVGRRSTTVEEEHMAQTAERRDTFFVRPENEIETSNASDSNKASRITVLTLPSGNRVHALERKVFNHAVREAMKPLK